MRPEDSRAAEEFQLELRRVGVSWDELTTRLIGEFPEKGGFAAIGVDAGEALPVLRALPDGAGTEAFLARYGDRVHVEGSFLDDSEGRPV